LSLVVIRTISRFFDGEIERENMKKSSKPITDPMDRREFCKKTMKRSSVVAAVGVAGYVVYKKPAVRRFFGVKDAYAASTAATAGKFTLKGDSN
jgi:hypothetical protein